MSLKSTAVLATFPFYSSTAVAVLHFTQHNRVQLIHGGREFFQALLDLISKAQVSIYFQTYIFSEDETGKSVAQALMNAATRGVKVFLLLDGYASQNLSDTFVESIKASGITFRWFEPLLRSEKFYVGRRMHHKVLAVDAHHCLVGGINITNRYNDINGHQAWLDWAIHAEGEVAVQVFQVCARRAVSKWNGSKKFKFIEHPPTHVKDICRTRMVVNDWVRGKRDISKSYLEMFTEAQDHIIIMSSYFLPGRDFRKKMREAARRNVRVTVVLTQESDVALAKSAERYLYHWLFKNKIEVYEYTKTVLHGKIAVCDQHWVSVGSYNLNELSAKASVEMNLVVADGKFGAAVHSVISHIIQSDCVRITPDVFENHTRWYDAAWQKISYNIARILLFLFTFYFKRVRG